MVDINPLISHYVNWAHTATLCACAKRGVDTMIVTPARNADFAVAAASRSYYADLLCAGVKIFEYEAGLRHAKTLTTEGRIMLMDSAGDISRAMPAGCAEGG